MNILQMSFCGAVIILVTALLRAAAKNRLPKKTFLALWGIAMLRLLVPYDLPSSVSVYSWIDTNSKNEAFGETSDGEFPALFEKAVTVDFIRAGGKETASANPEYAENAGNCGGEKYEPETPANNNLPLSESQSPYFVLRIVWFSGAALLGVFFALAYFRCRAEFKTSLPAENEFITIWLKEHKLKRRFSVRQSDKITAPLTYGILRPVILVPKEMLFKTRIPGLNESVQGAERTARTDFNGTKQLEYVLLHEYVHIRRFDSLLKLICVAVLCLHWFNPAVWLMYFLFNRDIELICDECTVKRLGIGSKTEYARMLIDLEEKKAGLTPLCSGFGKNSVKERIISVMKTKKITVLAIIAAVALTAIVAAVFATSAKPAVNEDNESEKASNLSYPLEENNEKQQVIDASFSSEEKGPVFSESDFEKMLALKFDNYEEMSVAEFQDKVWKMTDTDEYLELFERFSKYEKKFDIERNETADFVLNTLFPLTGTKWQRQTLSGSFLASTPELSIVKMEYEIFFTINEPLSVTVGEYVTARKDIPVGLKKAMDNTTRENYRDDDFIRNVVAATSQKLTELYSTDELKISIRTFMTHEYYDGSQESHAFPNASQSDYESLLKLKKTDYQNMSLKDFNEAVLEWTNEDHERSERVSFDILYDDFTADLSEKEKSFITLTFDLSQTENGEIIRSNYTGNPEKDPSMYFQLASKIDERNGFAARCDLYCGFSYHIENRETVTVGERDNRVGGMINDINEFWDEADIEVLLKMTEKDIIDKIKKMAENHSGSGIIITVDENKVGFERMDERGLDAERYADENRVNAEEYKEYEPFGLTVNHNDLKLYYDGKLVRCFDDQYPTGFFTTKSIGYYEEGGVIDIRAVREGAELMGLEVLTQDEFNSREIRSPMTAAQSPAASIFDPYAEYGLEYSQSENALYYKDKRVRLFWDSPSAYAEPSKSESPFITTISNWDGKGEIDLYVVRDYKNKDDRGYGKITELHIADNEEFNRDTEIFGNESSAAEYT